MRLASPPARLHAPGHLAPAIVWSEDLQILQLEGAHPPQKDPYP